MSLLLDNVSYSYDGKQVFEGVCASVEKGEILLVAGPNGSGKSTLAKICAGVLDPTGGAVLVNGVSPADALYKLEYIASNSGLISNRTVVENIVLKLRYHPELGARNTKEAVDEVCARFGLDRYRRNLPSQISGGIRKKVALARAFIGEPEVLIIDSLSQDIDEPEALRLLDMLKSMSEEVGTTIILFSGRLEPELKVATSTAILRNGTLSPIYKPSEARSDPWLREPA